MKNRKGFTLIELMATVLLISLLLLIGIPAIMKYMKQGTNSYYHSIENEMKVSGMDYMESYRTLLPRQISHVTVVDLEELVDNKYIDPVVDEKGNTCTGQVAIKKLRNNNYEYHSCLRCSDNYESEEQECDYDESKNEYADSSLYTVKAPEGQFRVKQLETFVAPHAEVYYNDQLIKTDLEGKPGKLDTSRVGTYEIKYYYHGAIDSIFVEVYDDTKPSQTQVVLKYDNKNGKSYKENWYSGNIYAEYKATDYTKNGVEGSGIAYYETKIGLDGEWTRISDSSETISVEGDVTRYVRAIDNNGNIGPEKEYRIKIDKTAPTHCSWEGESTTWQPNLNLPAAQQITSRTIKATCHDDISGCTNDTKTHTWTETASNKTKTLTYNMYDLAGNKTVCTKNANIYLDKTKPTITAVLNPKTLGNGDYNFTSNVTPNDVHSGVASTVCNPVSSRKSGTYDVTCTVTDKMGLTALVTFAVKHNYAATYNPRTCRQSQTCYTPQTCTLWGEEKCGYYCTCGHHSCDPWGVDEYGNPKQYFNSTCCNCAETYSCYRQNLGEYSCPQPYDCSYNYDCSYYTCPQGGTLSGSTCYY